MRSKYFFCTIQYSIAHTTHAVCFIWAKALFDPQALCWPLCTPLKSWALTRICFQFCIHLDFMIVWYLKLHLNSAFPMLFKCYSNARTVPIVFAKFWKRFKLWNSSHYQAFMYYVICCVQQAALPPWWTVHEPLRLLCIFNCNQSYTIHLWNIFETHSSKMSLHVRLFRSMKWSKFWQYLLFMLSIR